MSSKPLQTSHSSVCSNCTALFYSSGQRRQQTRTVGGERGKVRAAQGVGGSKASGSDGSHGLQRHSPAIAGAAGAAGGLGEQA